MIDPEAEPPLRSVDRPRRRWPWFVAAGTFLVGIIVGVVIAGLVSEGSPPPQTTAPGQPSSTVSPAPVVTSPSSATTSPGTTAEVVVNDACLRALADAQDVYAQISDVANAITKFDLAKLDQIVRALQPLQATLRADIGDCKISTRLPDGVMLDSSLPRHAPSVPPATGQTPTGPSPGASSQAPVIQTTG